MKIVKWATLGLVAVIVIGLIVTFISLNSIVRRAIQSQASSQLGVETTLNSANVSIFGGNVALNDLKIGSPKGFTAPHLFTLGGTEVNVSISQLTKDPIRIKSIAINKPTLVIEQQNRKLNFRALVDQMPSPPTAEPEKGADQKPPMKLIIDHLEMNDASVLILPGEIPGLKLPEKIDIALPSFSLENIGDAEGNGNGAAIKQVITEVITTMAAKAADSDKLPPELKSMLSLDVDAISAQLGAKFNSRLDNAVGDLAKKLPGELGKNVDLKNATSQPSQAVEQGLKGLLDGDKRKKTK